MIARVIVNHLSKSVDRFFDYQIPEGMDIDTGYCVNVPFGPRNKLYEAYVFEVLKSSPVGRMKKIHSIGSKGRVFDERMKKLILWMRERYLCTYLDVLHCIVPAGSRMRSREFVRVVKDAQLTGRSREIYEFLQASGGCAPTEVLSERFQISGQLRAMADAGIITFYYEEYSTVKDKTVKGVSLDTPVAQAEAMALKIRKKAPAQAKVLDFLMENSIIALEDLKQFTGVSTSSVKALQEKGMVREMVLDTYREPVYYYRKAEPAHTLSQEQRDVLTALEHAIAQQAYRGILLHGVTGSGKTEVFLRAIEKALEAGKQAIVLVPEISLTPQTVNRFVSRFGQRVAVFHSGLSLGEKYDQWKKIRDGKVDIVIGARSAVFVPFERIGIIVMDEEHSETYKSEMNPRYQTKEVAEFRCRTNGAVLLLTSATPSVESYKRAEEGVYQLLKMEKRINDTMPDIQICDMRKELEDGNKSMFSRQLQKEIADNVERGEQTILFLNRRGFSTFVSCRQCGFVAQCPNCNISMTYHKIDNTLRCHYCGHTIDNFVTCPSCNSKYIRYFGGGTQKVEEEVRRLFPQASTIRMDVDTTGKKQSHEKILSEFEKKKIDILIGTQMVAKGLDFENVTLVGVITADTMLHIDDFRSGERTFGVLEQVTGRAGRGSKPGRAVIQTYNPEHEAVLCVKNHDYMRFYQGEKAMRRIMWYPPYCDMVSVLFSGTAQQQVQACAKFFAQKLAPLKHMPMKTVMLGPIASSISKIKNKYRWQILLKCENAELLNGILAGARQACFENDNYKEVVIAIDKNPNNVY